MIFIVVKVRVRPEFADAWPQLVDGFSRATRSEAGCLWFDWSRSLDDPHEYVLLEAFRDDAAGAAHVQSPHFQQAMKDMPAHLVETPRIVNVTLAQDEWSLLTEWSVPATDPQ